jgi:ABC-type transporter Mla subunit MlaD
VETRQDFYVGLLIVVAIALVIGALIATSGWGERRYDVFLRVNNAEGLTQDTKVYVQGLDVGSVRSVVPVVDSTSGRVSFLARLAVAEEFPGGSRLRLPAGTRAEVDATNPLAAARINLLLPDTVGRFGRAFLGAGDTVTASRRGSPMDQVAEVASALSKQVEDVLRQTGQTLARVQATVNQTERTMRTTTPDVVTTLNGLASTISRIDTVVGTLTRAGLADTLTATLVATSRLVARLDTIAGEARAFTTENRSDLREAVTNLTAMSRQLNHFVDELSRRPYRMLTGVKPLPPDTVRRDTSRVSAKP